MSAGVLTRLNSPSHPMSVIPNAYLICHSDPPPPIISRANPSYASYALRPRPLPLGLPRPTVLPRHWLKQQHKRRRQESLNFSRPRRRRAIHNCRRRSLVRSSRRAIVRPSLPFPPHPMNQFCLSAETSSNHHLTSSSSLLNCRAL